MKPKYRDVILRKFNERLDYMTDCFDEVWVIRCDSHFPYGYKPRGDNSEASSASKLSKEHFTRKGAEMQYIRAREQAKSPVHHYHDLIIIDASKIKGPKEVFDRWQYEWGNAVEHRGRGLIERDKNCILIKKPSPDATGAEKEQQERDRKAGISRAQIRAKYLAKTKTKGNAPDGVKEFFCSQLKKKKDAGC